MDPRAPERTTIVPSATILAALAFSLAAGTAPAGEGPATSASLFSPHPWEKIDEGKTGEREGSMLLWAPDLNRMLLAGGAVGGDPEKGKPFTRVYDCGANRMFLLDAGPAPDGYSVGWMYDAKRKLAYAFTTNGEAWAIRIVPETAARLEKAEE